MKDLVASRREKIDFLIVGAGKSGTTSLFKSLAAHPEIFMPQQKEISFFSQNDRFQKGTRWYLDTYFRLTQPQQICGEASPAYMYYDSVPQRIADSFPQVKLLAILRNPIDRAFSHYRHATRDSSGDVEPFYDSVRRLINRGPVPDDRMQVLDGLHAEYVRYGEYGRILQDYYRWFSRDQIYVCTYDDLKADPAILMRNIYAWLGVNSSFTSDVFHRRSNVGGQLRYPLLSRSMKKLSRWGSSQAWLKESRSLQKPREFARSLMFKFNTEMAVKRGTQEKIEDRAVQLLKGHYAADVALLQDLLGRDMGWHEFSQVAASVEPLGKDVDDAA